MKYFKRLDENGEIDSLYCYHTEVDMKDSLMFEITSEEYEAIRSELSETPESSETADDVATIEDYERALSELGV